MVQVQDAAALLWGAVLRTAARPKFVENKPVEGQFDGATIMLDAGSGIAMIKMSQKHVELGLLPSVGEMHAAICSPYAYAREQGLGNMGYSWMRHATVEDLEQINAHLVPQGASAR